MSKSRILEKRKRKASISSVDKKSGNMEYGLGLFVSNLNIHAFIYNKKTKLVSFGISSCSKKIKSCEVAKQGTVELAKITGKEFRNSVDKVGFDISKLYFNRSGCVFHGRVKAFHDGFFLIGE